MKRLLTLLLALLTLLSFTSCTKKDSAGETNTGDKQQTEEEKLAAKYDAIKLPSVVTGSIVFDGVGKVEFEIYPNTARQSCLNFIYLVNSGHYNGVIVDRIVKDVVIQAGDYASGFVPRNTEFDYGIVGEFEENGIKNTMHHMKGTLSWVRESDDYDSAHTEFAIYVNSATSWDLDGKYAAFGIIKGDDSFKVLEKINKRKTYAEKPIKEIQILSVTLDPIKVPGFDASFEFPPPNFIKKSANASDNAVTSDKN